MYLMTCSLRLLFNTLLDLFKDNNRVRDSYNIIQYNISHAQVGLEVQVCMSTKVKK